MADIDLKSLSDQLYSSWAARDLFAKVLPGAIVLGAICINPSDVAVWIDKSKEFPVWIGLSVIVPLCWITGFFAQSVGELLRLVRAFPSDETEEQFRQRMVDFQSTNKSPIFDLQRERYVVTKEATSNCGVAGLLAVTHWLVVRLDYTAVPGKQESIFLLTALIASVVLIRHGRIGARRQRDYELRCIAKGQLAGNHTASPRNAA